MWTIEQVPFDHPDGARLRAAQRAELDARYGTDDHEPGAVPSAADVPVFLVATDADGRPIACGGLRPLAEEVLDGPAVEVKRMFVEPGSRGSGVAAALLHELERRADSLGPGGRVVLETGTMQPDAMRFYEREGYRRIDLYGPYVGSDNSVCYERGPRS